MKKKRAVLEPIHPGEILLEEFMKPLGISINRLARDIAVAPGRVSEIVNGKRSVSADTALRLGKFFGVSAETWIDLQSDYDLRVARRTTWPKVERRVLVLGADKAPPQASAFRPRSRRPAAKRPRR